MKVKRNLFGFRKRVSNKDIINHLEETRKNQVISNININDYLTFFTEELKVSNKNTLKVNENMKDIHKEIYEIHRKIAHLDNFFGTKNKGSTTSTQKRIEENDIKRYVADLGDSLSGKLRKSIRKITLDANQAQTEEIVKNIDFNSDLIRERQTNLQKNINFISEKFNKNHRVTRNSIVDLNDKIRSLKNDITEIKRMPVVRGNDCNNCTCTTQSKSSKESAYTFATIRHRGNLIAIDDRVMTSAEVATHLGVSRRAVTNNVAGLDRVKKNGTWFFKTKEVENYSQKKVAKLHRNK